MMWTCKDSDKYKWSCEEYLDRRTIFLETVKIKMRWRNGVNILVFTLNTIRNINGLAKNTWIVALLYSRNFTPFNLCVG